MNSFRWLGWGCCPALLANGVACTFEDRQLRDFNADPQDQASGRPPPSGGSGGSTMVLAGNGGSANASSNGTSGTSPGTGGSRNGVAAGGSGQVAASGGGSSAAPLSGCAAPGACTGNGIPIGSGLVILPDASGFVRGETNGLGIQGAVYTASDLNNSGERGNTGSASPSAAAASSV